MKFIVFDGNSILNRAFYGIPPLTTNGGIPTNAVLGFINIIEKNMAAVHPDYAVIAFDLPEKTFRHKAVASYKANRKGMPEELAVQLPYAYKAAEGLGLHIVTMAGYEADDILGTVAKASEQNGVECVIVTGDRDSLQLVSDKTTVYLAATNETKIFDVAAVKEKYGIGPELIVDLKAIMGDSSDNIKGVAGIGEKGAVKLLTAYGSLDGIYQNLDSVKGSVNQKLQDGKESAYESRFLAEICTSVPIDTNLTSYAFEGKDASLLIPLYKELEFSSLLEKMEASGEGVKKQIIEFTEGNVSVFDQNFPVFIRLENDKLFCTDGEKYIVTDAESIKNIAKPAAWSVKDTLHDLDKLGISGVEFVHDVSLMCYVASPADSGLTVEKAINAYMPGESVSDYAAALPKIFDCVKDILISQDRFSLYEDIELPLAKVLYSMEKQGFYVDEAGIRAFGEALAIDIKEAENSVYFCAGEEFNINSPKQLGHILFEVLGLGSGKTKKTKSGYSTDAETLNKLKDEHPIIDYVLHYRTLAKLKSTYTDGMLSVISPEDNRIHTTFRQTLTQTGRLSSVEPNLQNIPVRTELGRELRRFFVAEEGKVLVDADYSQIELRVLAAMSGDQTMINAFKNGTDIHTLTAADVFGVPVDMVTSSMRKQAKAVNFGIVYGISSFSLAQDIGVTRKEAEAYINAYFLRFPAIKAYLESCKETAKELGYVTTLFGRRRYIPELKSPKATLRAFGERVAMNSPIQGTAADIIKIAMVKAHKALAESGLDAKLILQVHDELIVECNAEDGEKVKDILVNCMENTCDLPVPMKVDAHIGKTWYDAKGE